MINPLQLLDDARRIKEQGLPGFDASLVSWADDGTIEVALEAVRSASHVSFDLETTGLNEYAPGARVVLLSLTLPKRGEMNAHTWLIPLSHKKGAWFGEWREILRRFAIAMQETGAPLIAHNGPFDVRWIAAHTGIDLSDRLTWDTMVAEHLLDENSSTKLKECVPRRFQVKRWDDFDLSSPGAAERAPLIQLGLYAARDTFWTWILYLAQQRDLWLADGLDPDEDPDSSQGIRLGNLAVECVMPMVRNLTGVQVRGLQLDQEWVREHLETLEQDEARERSVLVPRYKVENSIGDPSFAPTSKWFRAWTAQAVEKGDLRVDSLTGRGVPQWNKTVLNRQAREGSEVATKLLALRQASKQQEFLRSWMELVSPNSRIHANYNVGRVSTGRLSSSDPNLQQVSKALKPAFIPTPGYYIAEIDFSQIELRMAAFIARCEPMMEAYRRGDDLHRLMAAEVTQKDPGEVSGAERQQAKACIAAGSLVDTDRGPVPIEEVMLEDLVWDGGNWVRHGGVVYQGIRKVASWDGLTATADHLVLLQDSSTVCFGYAYTNSRHLARTSPSFTAAGVPSSGGLHSEGRASSQDAPRDVHPMREVLQEGCCEHYSRNRPGVYMPTCCEVRPRSSGGGTGGAVRRDGAAVQAPRHRDDQELWGSRNQGAVSVPRGVHSLGLGEIASPDVPRSGHRSDRLGRGLRGGELALDLQVRESGEQAVNATCSVHGSGGCPNAFVAPAETGRSSVPTVPPVGPSVAIEGSKPPGDSEVPEEPQGSPVYDIANAGPKHCFSVSGRLVHNCNFGFLYGQEAPGFVNYAESSYGVLLTLDEAVEMREAFFTRWEGMAEWHESVARRVRREGFVTSPIGRVRRLEDALGNDAYLVAQAERQAINSPVQSFASDIMQMTAADIGGQFGNPVPRVRIVGTVHDSLVVEVPIDDWQRSVGRVMRRMINPHHLLERLGCYLDVPLAVESSVGTRWGLSDVATVVS
jgi:DNA polymerase I-like protein with 3'-5' exonuclease and polymerase domains